jgi:hypothetical protein
VSGWERAKDAAARRWGAEHYRLVIGLQVVRKLAVPGLVVLTGAVVAGGAWWATIHLHPSVPRPAPTTASGPTASAAATAVRHAAGAVPGLGLPWGWVLVGAVVALAVVLAGVAFRRVAGSPLSYRRKRRWPAVATMLLLATAGVSAWQVWS